MKNAFKLSSLGLQQIRYLLILSLCLSVIFSTSYVLYSFLWLRDSVYKQQTSIEQMAVNTSAFAASTLDEDLAQKSLKNLQLLGDTDYLRLYDNRDTLLASLESSPARNQSTLVKILINLFHEDRLYGDVELYVTVGADTLTVGRLSYKISVTTRIQEFLWSVFVILLIIGAQTLGTSFIIALYFYRRITMPINRMIEFFQDAEQHGFTDRPMLGDIYRFQGEIRSLALSVNQLLTDFYNHQDQLTQLATTDWLTQIFNRNEILNQLNGLIQTAADGHNKQIAVIFLDLDRFKHVNDSLGHDYGDELLRVLALRLSSYTLGQATVGRLGGDEFLILFPCRYSAKTLQNFLTTLVAVIEQPLSVQDRVISTEYSAGVAIYPKHAKSVNGLLKCADQAMYAAKRQNQKWLMFSQDMAKKLRRREFIADRISHSSIGDLFCLVYQPKIDLASGRCVGCEALLRWREDENIDIYETIIIAEEMNLITRIGDWVFKTACDQLASWQRSGFVVKLSFNVSAKQLLDLNFVEKLERSIEKSGVNPKGLEMEITETILMTDFKSNKIILDKVRRLGISISLDDFGIGYSSLAYLAELDIDVLKIDRAFVTSSDKSNSLLATIVSIAMTLGLDLVAEGIENSDQQERLLQLGTLVHQGFYYSRPLSPKKMQRFLVARAVRHVMELEVNAAGI